MCVLVRCCCYCCCCFVVTKPYTNESTERFFHSPHPQKGTYVHALTNRMKRNECENDKKELKMGKWAWLWKRNYTMFTLFIYLFNFCSLFLLLFSVVVVVVVVNRRKQNEKNSKTTESHCIPLLLFFHIKMYPFRLAFYLPRARGKTTHTHAHTKGVFVVLKHRPFFSSIFICILSDDDSSIRSSKKGFMQYKLRTKLI